MAYQVRKYNHRKGVKWQSEKNQELCRTIHYTEKAPIITKNDTSNIINIGKIFNIENPEESNFIYQFINRIIKHQMWQTPEYSIEFCDYVGEVLSLNISEVELYDQLQQFYCKNQNITNKLKGDSGEMRGAGRVKSIKNLFKYKSQPTASCYLDVGCFDGHITKAVGSYFKLHKLQIHGIDIDNFIDDTSINKSSPTTNGITFTKCPTFSEKLPYSNDSFDLITCLMVLHHIPKQHVETLIGELYRVMKPGGTLILREHNVEKKIECMGLDIMHRFYDNVWNKSDSILDVPNSWNVSTQISPNSELPENKMCDEKKWEICNYKSCNEWDDLFVNNNFTPAIKPNIYKNSERNPFMTYMRTYRKMDAYNLPSKMFRILTPDMPREQYHRRTSEIKSVIHWGQRKLLLTEIEFLTMYIANRAKTDLETSIYVIYAGSAPGTHILYLAQLFPHIHFELYDPREFCKNLKNNKMIRTHVQYFTDDTAKEWISTDEKHQDKEILLISDIRTGDTATMTPNEVENRVKIDHDWQRDWYYIMKPEMSMFKFRLLWNDETVTYLNGDIHIQPYPPSTSTETRLIVGKNANEIQYDNRKYEEQMFYFNNHMRVKEYDNILHIIPTSKKHGLQNTYDYALEVHILQNYINIVDYTKNQNIVMHKIMSMVQKISKTLSSRRTLYSVQPVKDYKKTMMKVLQKKGFIPKNIELNQRVFDIFIIPRYDWFISQKLIE
jgi:2-polyprenyl-3-methyl-5-hydroxy-6-metoxy-1,4-benzoquinol methylase